MKAVPFSLGLLSSLLLATTAAHAADTIKIGVPTSLTGPYVELGEEVKRGAQFAADEINAKGGIKGRKIELSFADEEGNPDAGRRVAEKLVRSGFRLLTGPISSAVGLAIGSQVEKWDALYISGINKSDRLTGEACNPRMFRANHSDSMDMAVIGPWLKTRKEANWVVMAADYAWGRDSAGAFSSTAGAGGKSVKSQFFAPLGTKDYAPYIQQIKDAKPEGMWVAIAGRDAVNFGIQAKQFGLMGSVFTVGQSFAVPSTIKGMGDVAEGVWGVVNYTATIDAPGNKAFVANWTKSFGKDPANFEAETYVAMLALFAAIEKAGTDEPGAVAKALSTISFDTPFYGKVTMRPADNQLLLPNYIGRVARVNGELKTVVEMTVPAADAVPPPSKDCKL
ncbi:MAG: branched-chain amino acid ABC transporter substrate-binding protein [Xanthobacteraceae bacterium]|nr:MAG: branched-chain amino acid ABC transporter substrate-binding protein [Xanthobacteraceae bacterium]